MFRKGKSSGGALWLLPLLFALGCTSKPEEPEIPQIAPTLTPLSAGSDHAFSVPFDATVAPGDGGAFFTATTEAGAAIMASRGGDTAVLFEGEPLAAPLGIAISTDGQTLFIADPGAPDVDGALFSMPAAGGTPAMISGTEGYRAGGIVVAPIDGADRIVFSAMNPQTGVWGVYQLDATGGPVTALAEDESFGPLGGVAVGSNGSVFVVDTLGFLFKVEERPSVLMEGFKTGYPAGLAITLDDSRLILSARNPETERDQLIFVNTADGSTSEFNSGLETFTEPAGLGRAPDRDEYAWSDLTAGGEGTVFQVTLK